MKLPATKLFFGCWHDVGHYLHDASGSTVRHRTPWSGSGRWAEHGGGLDGTLAPGDSQARGRAKLHVKDGWTALAFWDRSVDTRPNSNGVFLVDEELNFREAVVAFAVYFPRIAERVRAIAFKEAAK